MVIAKCAKPCNSLKDLFKKNGLCWLHWRICANVRKH